MHTDQLKNTVLYVPPVEGYALATSTGHDVAMNIVMTNDFRNAGIIIVYGVIILHVNVGNACIYRVYI